MKKEQFDLLSDEDAFALCNQGVIDGETNGKGQATPAFDITKMAYQLEYKNIAGVYSTCKLCEMQQCKGCLVPFNDETKIEDQLDKLGLSRNDTLFGNKYNAGKELVFNVSWHSSIMTNLFDFLATAESGRKLESEETNGEENKSNNGQKNIQLTQCLQEFKQSETLDEDNKWYCNKCQEHVQATKTLELYRVPKVLIISFKRFKTSRNRYGMGGGQKIDTHVDFPLEGLDMRPFVLMPEQKNSINLLYDCYGISNHFGGVGGGHYTAYAKNPISNKWYNFDDSHASEV